jgi:muconolactone delta-isomerase
MLFLVISEPQPEPPSAASARRQAYWRWIAPLQAAGVVRSVHARVGRGAAVLFDVPDHATLHRHLTDWCELIPATFTTYPLLDPDAAQRFLAQGGG